MRTRVYRASADNPSADSVKAAAEAILDGKLVVFPTETVYGIGANAYDEKACMEIYNVKGRASDNPLIVHVYSMEEARKIGVFGRKDASVLEKIWPGPLTVIVKSRGNLPGVVTAGLGSVAIRCPKGKLIRAVMKRVNVPIAAPSANISERPSSTKGLHAINYFKGKVSVIIDCGATEYGIESTILDLRGFRIMRPGAFTAGEIQRAFGRKPVVDMLTRGIRSSRVPVSPGTKYRHYSPATPLFIYTGGINGLADVVRRCGKSAAFIGSDEGCSALRGLKIKRIALGPEKDMMMRASSLFDALIRLDTLGVDFGIIEPFSEKGIGLAAMNRIRKATIGRSFSDFEELGILLKGA